MTVSVFIIFKKGHLNFATVIDIFLELFYKLKLNYMINL